MRRTIVLLATMTLALLLVGGVAVSKQLQEQSTSSQSTTTNKMETSPPLQSTKVKASFANGSGANFLGVKVSTHGNLISFESPANQEAVFNGPSEGYVVCSSSTDHGHDTGGVEGGFGTPTFSQPNGAGTFPLTVTRNTTDGKFELKQVWAKPDATEKDVTVTMTLKNISTSTINGVVLARTGEFDVGTSGTDRGARTADSVWQWDDVNGPDSPAVGLMLTALTFRTSHQVNIESTQSWLDITRTKCAVAAQTTPTAPGNFAMKANYVLGNLSAGQSKTVKYEYRRM
jgi:hypothetical protein